MTTLAYLFGSVVPPILTSNDTHLFVELGPLPTFHFMATIKTVVSTWASFYYVQSTFRWSRGVLYRNLDWVDVIDFTFEGFSTDHRSYGGVCGSIADSALLVQSTYHPPPPTLEKRRKEKKRKEEESLQFIITLWENDYFCYCYQTCAGAAMLTDVVFWLIIFPFLTYKAYTLNFVSIVYFEWYFGHCLVLFLYWDIVWS